MKKEECERVKLLLMEQFSWLYKKEEETKAEAIQRIEKRGNDILNGTYGSLEEEIHFQCILEQQNTGLVSAALKYLNLESDKEFNEYINILYFDELNIPIFLERKKYWQQQKKEKSLVRSEKKYGE